MWQNKSEALLHQPLANPTSWAGAFQHDLVKLAVGRRLQAPVAAAPAYLAAAAVMMVKDEADIIGENLLWMFHTGLRRIIILDNDSTDATAAIVERFRRAHGDVELLVLKDPLLRYMQSEKTTGLFRLAISIWPDLRWVIPVDADEFLIAEAGLAALDEVARPADAVVIPKVIHFRQDHGLDPGDDAMADMACRSSLFFVPPKIIARPNPLAIVTQGNHQIRFADEHRAVYEGGLRHGLYYREFPNRSFAHFLRKVRNGGTAIKAAEAFLGHRIGGWHWVDYHEILTTQGPDQLRAIYQRDCIRQPGGGFVLDEFLVDASALRN